MKRCMLFAIICAIMASTMANKCISDCERFKFGEVPEPKTGYDTYVRG